MFLWVVTIMVAKNIKSSIIILAKKTHTLHCKNLEKSSNNLAFYHLTNMLIRKLIKKIDKNL